MKRNYIIALMLSMAILFPVFSINVSAQAPDVVYTEFVQGNFNHAGDGTAASPYNLFEDAFNAVADGGTIYILGGGAFINVLNGNDPFEVTKNVTIAAAPGIGHRPCLSVRTGGMVLGGDVTFENIVLSFANAYRPVVCANGYTMIMNNVSYHESARTIHLAGGGMPGFSDIASGTHSRIIVKGRESSFGNIYAGSINGSFDKDVDITVNDISGMYIGSVYSCGAAEGYYNGENFLDPDNEPQFPVDNPNNYPVAGRVSIELNNTGIGAVYGMTGGEKNASLSVSTENLYSCSLIYISDLQIKKGIFMPDVMNDGVNVTVNEGASFDMHLLIDCIVNNFTGGGILINDFDGCLTINGTCEGTTEFRTYGAYDNSYIALYNHLYIKTASGTGTFTFNPYPTQKDMTLEKRDDGWYTSEHTGEDIIALTKFDIDDDLIFVRASEINGGNLMSVNVMAEFTEDIFVPDISYIPFEYNVTYNGEKFFVKSDEMDGEYYEGNIKPLNMNFRPVEDVIEISNFSEMYDDFGDIAEGVYDIDIIAPTVTGNVIRSLRLVVLGDDAETDEFIVTDTDGDIHATYTNVTESDINDAVILGCVYQNGVLISVKQDSLTVVRGQSQSFRFDMSDIEYDKVRIFVWDSPETMIPLSGGYSSQ